MGLQSRTSSSSDQEGFRIPRAQISRTEFTNEDGRTSSNSCSRWKLEVSASSPSEDKDKNSIEDLRADIIGEDLIFGTPFGHRKCLYLDQTASGRCVKSIEDFISQNVLPLYGNTHSTTSFCASQIGDYREESRTVISEYCGGGPEDVVLFTGAGATSALHKLIHSVVKTGEPRPIILIGPFEHHSNIVPWREVAKEVINLKEDKSGLLDMKFLEKTLKKLRSGSWMRKRKIIGTFSAASNVTGVLTDDVAVTVMMHKYGGLAVWDYAAGAPHLQIHMNPQTGNPNIDELAKKDALFFSGHKFTGGPQTPGILMAKKRIFQNPVPHNQGGGTVLFVTPKRHQYLPDIVEREEGGTPDIIGSIRMGLVLQLKHSLGIPLIISREARFTKKVLKEWAKVPEIKILGSTSLHRIPILSFMIKHLQSGLFLHHDFVVALLNDLFGIQCRGGCMCAGPYAMSLLGIQDDLARIYENMLSKSGLPQNMTNSSKLLKPGFSRISLPFHASDEEIDFIIKAVQFVATEGWKLLPIYKMDLENGTFRIPDHESFERTSIKSFRVQNDCRTNDPLDGGTYPNFEECLDFAEDLIQSVETIIKTNTDTDLVKGWTTLKLPYRWFLLPDEAEESLRNPWISWSKIVNPICPKDNYNMD